ncbi:response regulator [Patescibacteria group bacterium]|nr:response regulator [Patescibacteria group bacterium]
MKNSTTHSILIIEDELPLRKALVEKFKHEGFEVFSAADGEEGLATAISKKPDILLTDIIMPKIDGITMLAQLRAASTWGKEVPVIMLTNVTADDEITRAVNANEPAYYLVKSNWSINDIVKKVRERLATNTQT